MTPLTAAKIALFVVAVILFAYGIRADSSGLRFAAIGFLAAAFLLRFLKKDSPK